jgi:hypothetical protein
MTFPCEFDHLWADVNSDAAGRTERRKQITAAGANLEDGRSRRNQEPMDRLEQPIVGAISAPPVLFDGREAVKEVRDGG